MPDLLVAAAVIAGILAGSAQAIGERSDAVLRTATGERSDAVLRTAMPTVPVKTERDLFVSVCTPRMSARIAKQPEIVCGCLHDNAVSREEDSELRLALIRGVEETGVPSIQYAWVPNKSQERVVEALDKVAAPTLACMFGPR